MPPAIAQRRDQRPGPRRDLRFVRRRAWLAALGVLAVTTGGCSGHPAPRAASSRFPLVASARFPLVVATDRGAVRGVISADGQVANFLGIAYAAPPVGALRWRPPQPVAAWTGVRAADHYGKVCAQPSSGDGPGSTSEDCLYINVQRPARGYAAAVARVCLHPRRRFDHGGRELLQHGEDRARNRRHRCDVQLPARRLRLSRSPGLARSRDSRATTAFWISRQLCAGSVVTSQPLAATRRA